MDVAARSGCRIHRPAHGKDVAALVTASVADFLDDVLR